MISRRGVFHFGGTWALRAGIVFLIYTILILEPNPLSPRRTPGERIIPEDVIIGPDETVQTENEQVCLHTRVTDEVEEGKIQKTFIMAREMGAATVVEYLPWAYVEYEKDEYDWNHPDRILLHMENQGIRPIIRLGFVPDWLRPEEDEEFTNANFLSEEAADEYIEYVGDFVERYAGVVDTIIIWNEPNLNLEWSESGSDPVEYTALLHRAYDAAHAANPDIIVLGGALAPTNEPPHGIGGWNDIDFLNEMYLAGAGNYMDGLAAHVYGFDQPPQAEPDNETLNFRRIELIRDVMVENGYEGHTVYVTEGGWNDHPRWVHAVRPGQRIAFTMDAYDYARESYPWMEVFCLWAFRYPAPTNRYPDYFTLASAEFDPKPIYDVLRAYARGEEMPDWLIVR
jgi:hypothetical protein